MNMNREGSYQSIELAKDFIESSPGYSLNDINLYDDIIIRTTDFSRERFSGRLQLQIIPWPIAENNTPDKPKRAIAVDTNLPGIRIGSHYMIKGASLADYTEERNIIRLGCSVMMNLIEFTLIYKTDIGKMPNDEIIEYYNEGYIEKYPDLGYVHPSLAKELVMTPSVVELSKVDGQNGEKIAIDWLPSTDFKNNI